MFFLSVLVAVTGLVILSLWQCMALVLPSSALAAAKITTAAMNVLAVAAFFYVNFKVHANPDDTSPVWANAVTVAAVFVVAEILFCVFVGVAVAWQKFCRYFYAVPFDPGKRAMIKHGVLYPLTALIMSVYGSAFERKNVVVRRFFVDVPGEFAPYKIAQLSDIHLGLFFSLDDLRDLLDRTVALKPEALVITGDLFDDERQNEAAAKLLGEYSAQFADGIFFCWGNHEYYRNIVATRRYIGNTPVKLLENEWMSVRGRLVIAGVDYPMRRDRFAELKDEYAAKAMDDLPQDAVTVLLAHHPEFIDNAAEHNVLLTLTGHTHGSQFGIFGYPLFPFFKYTRGIVRVGGSIGYVHSGNGSWFPLRIGCPPEIAVFTLSGK